MSLMPPRASSSLLLAAGAVALLGVGAKALREDQLDGALQAAEAVAESNTSASECASAGWPHEPPWNQLDTDDPRELGRGGFGTATRYYTHCSKRDSVVVKQVRQSSYASEQQVKEKCRELINEADVQIKMADKGKAVKIFAMDPKDCSSATLEDRPPMNILMARALGDGSPTGKRPGYDLLLDITRQLVSGLRTLHEAGYLHRDMKPPNVLVEKGARALQTWADCEPGECRFSVSDFGLACKRPMQGMRTTCDKIYGDVHYFSPELAVGVIKGGRGKDYYSRAADYWSLGVALYEMATGKMPGLLERGFSTRQRMWEYLSGLRHMRDPKNWWKKYGPAKAMEADRNKEWADIFLSILELLLNPSSSQRRRAADERLDHLLAKFTQHEVSIPPVCLDPCNKCYDAGKTCRAGYLSWECAEPPPEPLAVTLTLLDAKPSVSVPLTLDVSSSGSQLSDLKLLAQTYFNMKADKAAWHYRGATDDLENRHDLHENDEFDVSPALRESFIKCHGFRGPVQDAERIQKEFALRPLYAGIAWDVETFMRLDVTEPRSIKGHGSNQNGKFTVTGSRGGSPETYKITAQNRFGQHRVTLNWEGGRTDTLIGTSEKGRTFRMTKQEVVPYLPAAKKILAAWPTQGWSAFMREANAREQAQLAFTLQPFFDEARDHISDPLSCWDSLLGKLRLSHEEKMQQERVEALQETTRQCQDLDLDHCATNVDMGMDQGSGVDYVKVEFKSDNDKQTVKFKFFSNGRIFRKHGSGEEMDFSQKTFPTLPVGVDLKITYCKNLMTQGGFHPIASSLNLFVKGESRCGPIAKEFKEFTYQLSAEGITETTQETPVDRKRMNFQVTASPKVWFKIWDGDLV